MIPEPHKSHPQRAANPRHLPKLRVRPTAAVVHGESVYYYELRWADQQGMPHCILFGDYDTAETVLNVLDAQHRGALFCLGTPSVRTIEAMIDVSDTLLAAVFLKGALGDEA